MMRRVTLSTLLLAVALLAPAQLALAQDDMRTETVNFAAGTTGTTVRDKITGREFVVYKLGAKAGQRLKIRLTSDNSATYFNVYEPGRTLGDEALAVSEQTGPMVPDLNLFDGMLISSGIYSVSVYLYRNAARRGETAGFSLDISITDDTGAAVQGDFADSLQGGPDFWEVRLSDPNGILNVHGGPSTGAPTVGRFPDAAILRNLGCRMNEGRRWCQIKATAPGGITGWVAGEFLVESSNGATDGDAMAPGTPYNATGTIFCARNADAPVQDCAFGVTRENPGSGNGSVTIDWPDGGSRVIFFEAGDPVSFDQSQADQGLEMTVSRTDDGVSAIHIGEERFDIPDSVIWGG